MKVKNYTEEIPAIEGVTVQLVENILTVTKDKASVKRNFAHPKIKLKVDTNKVTIVIADMTKREKTSLGTLRAHIKNMMQGVQEPFVYKLKICSGHFPMNVAISNNQLIIKNYIGEKVPRILTLREDVDVKVDGEIITVISPNKESAGQTAGAIEILCSRSGFDKRIFQQGIYITEKAGKAV
jgi:large subunit ribosomal protein L6